MQASYQKLKIAQNRFADAQQTLNTFTPDKEGTIAAMYKSSYIVSLGTEVFVPLTSSVYVKANLADVEKLMVDIGTGYYVDKVCYRNSTLASLIISL